MKRVAYGEAIVLDLTVIALIVLVWPITKWGSILLWPYAAWAAVVVYGMWECLRSVTL